MPNTKSVDEMVPLAAPVIGLEFLVTVPKTGVAGPSIITRLQPQAFALAADVTAEIARATSAEAAEANARTLAITNEVAARNAAIASAVFTQSGGGVALSTTLPVMDSVAAVGVSVTAARGDHSHASDASRYPVSNPAGYQTLANVQSLIAAGGGGVTAGVASFNTRSGAVALSSGDVTLALGYTPYNSANPTGYQTAAQVATAITAAGTGGGTGYVNAVISNVYTVSGAINITDTYVKLNSTSALAMTLGNGTVARPKLCMKNTGSASATVTMNLDLIAGTAFVMPPRASIELIWSVGDSSWLLTSQYDPGQNVSALATATLTGSQFFPVSELDGTLKKATLTALQTFFGFSGGSPSPTILVNAITAPAPSVAFSIGGTYTVTTPTALDYSDNGGSTWTAAPSPTIGSGNWIFNHPGMVAGTYSIMVRNNSATSVVGTSNSFTIVAGSSVGPTLIMSSPTFGGDSKFGSVALAGGSGQVGVTLAVGSRTFEAWIKVTGAADLHFFEDTGVQNGLYMSGGGLNVNLGGGFTLWAGAFSFADGLFHHVAVTYDAGTLLTHIFIDGVHRAQDNYVTPPLNPTMIVRGAADCIVDEASIFNSVKYPGTTTFTPASAAYTSAAANLVAAWHLDGNGNSA